MPSIIAIDAIAVIAVTAPVRRGVDRRVGAVWERAFVEEPDRPTGQTLATHLGAASGLFDRLEALTAGYSRGWQYARGLGWMFKVSDRRKVLLYVIPLRGAITVSMAVRDGERQVLLADPELAVIRETIAGSRRVSEGYAMRFVVATDAEYLPVAHLVNTVMALRRP